MVALKLAEKRHSVREYKHKPLSEAHKNLLFDLLNGREVINDGKIEFRFIEDGFTIAPLLENHAGYFGKMIYAPHYFAVLCSDHDLCHKMVGYEGERFILSATRFDIGTCWIEVLHSQEAKEILNIESEKEIGALIAVGYGKREFQQSTIYASSHAGSLSSLTELGYPNIDAYSSQSPASGRKAITEFVHLNQWGEYPTIGELEMLGIHEALFYMRLAPSYHNRQPWHFIVKGNEIDLVMEKSDHIPETIHGIDAGIAMLYFEVGLHDSGIPGKWQFTGIETDYALPDGYEVSGRYIV